MPGPLSGLLAPTAQLVDTFGARITLRARSTGAYNPSSSTVQVTDTDIAAKGVWEGFTLREIDGTTVRAGDRKLLIAAAGLASPPVPGMQVVAGTDVLDVVNVEAVMAGDEAVVYRCQVRK